MVLRYRQVPFEERLNYKDVSGTFCYDEAGKTLHSKWHGDIAGTLYIPRYWWASLMRLASPNLVLSEGETIA
jgi:hypothetical protein